jgi:phosphatidylglycerol lysyltransferase
MAENKSDQEVSTVDQRKPVKTAAARTEAAKLIPSETIKNLKLTRTPLSSTLMTAKLKQESAQSSVKSAHTASPTARFRLDQLQQHGCGSLAFSSLQSGMQYFMHPDYGYIAYVPLGNEPSSVCVLSDPICCAENLKPLINAFLQERSDPIFLHITRETAKALAQLDFCVNELGVETFIDLKEFTLSGNKRQQLRQARNNANRDNIKIREITSVDDALFKAFKRLGDEWMKSKTISDNEMQFIVRPVVYVDEVDVRRFVAIQDEQIVAFVIFDPMYDNGEVVGYIANHLRSILEMSYSIVDCLIS